MKPAEPGLVGNGLRATMRDLMRFATMCEVDHNIIFKVSDNLARRLRGGIRVVDPQDGLTRGGNHIALPNLTPTAQQPNIEFSLAPATGLIRRDSNGCLNVGNWGLDFGERRLAQEGGKKASQPLRSDRPTARLRWRTQTTASSMNIATSVQNGGILAQGPSR